MWLYIVSHKRTLNCLNAIKGKPHPQCSYDINISVVTVNFILQGKKKKKEMVKKQNMHFKGCKKKVILNPIYSHTLMS